MMTEPSIIRTMELTTAVVDRAVHQKHGHVYGSGHSGDQKIAVTPIERLLDQRARNSSYPVGLADENRCHISIVPR